MEGGVDRLPLAGERERGRRREGWREGGQDEEAYFYGGVGTFGAGGGQGGREGGSEGAREGRRGVLSSSHANRARWAEMVGGGPSPPSSSFQGLMSRRSGGREGGKICRFFIQGNCVHGDRCHNSHDPSALPPSIPPSLPLPVSSAQLNEGAEPGRGEEEMRRVEEEEERRSREAECMICTDGREGGREGRRKGGGEGGRE